jgi:hypothetical protein
MLSKRELYLINAFECGDISKKEYQKEMRIELSNQ